MVGGRGNKWRGVVAAARWWGENMCSFISSPEKNKLKDVRVLNI